ncbi:MAG TPA: hypothetical protein VJU77_19110 [Chthoniobacterales bacterium]|nr:hypothetical protein [Chthoniobacterales bacterium]
MKFLILAHRTDMSAAAVAAVLSRRHGSGACRLVAAEELVLAPRWVHRLDTDGVRSRVQLHDGTLIDNTEVGVVLHRLSFLNLTQFGNADRDYAGAEMSALLQSWLEGFPCPVINPVTTRGFAPNRTPTGWLRLATEAGLPVPRLRLTSNLRRFPADGLPLADGSSGPVGRSFATRGFAVVAEPPGPNAHSVLLAGEEVCGNLPPGLLPACRTFARLARALLLRLHFTSGQPHGARWLFRHAEILPMLDALELAAVVHLLERAAENEIPVQAEVA